MKPLLTRAGLRYLRRHPAQGWLALLGIALGVAVVIAVDLAVGSADQAFELSAQALTGRADYWIVGGPQGLDERLFTRLRIGAGLRASAPLVEGDGRLPRFGGMTVRLLGIDPLTDAAMRKTGAGAVTPEVLWQLLTVPRSVLVSRRTADHLHLAAGAVLQVLIHGRLQDLTVAAVITPTDAVAARGLDEVLIMDIASAQELLAMEGRLSRIDLHLPQGAVGERLRQRIRRLLPAGAALLPAAALNADLARMADAFRLNLHAMSLLGLVVGAFLIYNAVGFSVVQRRPLWAALRAVGVTRREIFMQVLQEAALLASAGIITGVVLGYLLGHGLVQVVLRTINDLYFTVAMSEPPTPSWIWMKGAALGAAATLAAAALPAWQAARQPVTQVLRRITAERQARRHLAALVLLGVALLGAGMAALTIGHNGLAWAFAALFIVVIGYALLIPPATRLVMGGLHALPLRALMIRMAVRGMILSLSRTGVAVAALAVVISVGLGMAVMIGSFRHTLSDWLNQTLQADLYLSAAGPSGAVLRPDFIAEVRALPEIAAVSTGRRFRLEDARGITEIFVLDPAPGSSKGFRFKAGDPAAAWTSFLRGDAILVSEPYATHHRLRVGDAMSLRTGRGIHGFTVAGIYYDYGSDQGVVTLSRATYLRWWRDGGVTGLGLYLKPGADSTAVAGKLRRLDRGQTLAIRPSGAVREAAMALFERTFAVTRVLQTVALLVAAVGMVSALAALQLDRGRELGVLRSLGMTRRQLWALVMGESLLMGLAAGLFALPLGLGLAWVLVDVIQAQAFGWTLAMYVAPQELLQVMLLALLAAAAAALYPAWRMARLAPLAVIREE
jgi:putative ABC transport system permease protein